MKIDKKEKLEILSMYYIDINEQRRFGSQQPTQKTTQGKQVYKRLPEVKEIQTKLKQLSTELGNPNLDPGNIDGVFGDNTLKAFNALVAIHNQITN